MALEPFKTSNAVIHFQLSPVLNYAIFPSSLPLDLYKKFFTVVLASGELGIRERVK